MALTLEQLRKLAEISIDGEFNHHSIDQFCQAYPGITEEEGYKAQEIRMKLVEEKGFHVTGYKLGGTSLAKVNQLKSTIYSDPNAVVPTSVITYGRLFDYMRMGADEDLVFESRLHPKVEPEFKIGWRYDALIDNTSAAAFKIGEGRLDPRKTNLNDIGMKLQLNGEYVGFGAGASIMGHPARAVAELVNALDHAGTGLKKGDIILSGAIVASTPVKKGDAICAFFGHMGCVSMNII